MFKQLWLGSFLGLFLIAGAASAEVIVQIAPPAAIVEVRPTPPSRRYVWIAGYHRWDGGRYVWVPGSWALPPRPHARWVPHRWVRRHDHWVLVEGHWR